LSDSLIIGGGIIGLLTAYELISAGQKVTLIERQELAQESSWAGGGILSPLYPWRYLDSINRLASHSQSIYAEFCQSLLSETGIDPEYTNNGMLVFADNEKKNARQWAEKHNQTLHIIDAKECSELEPQLSLNSNNKDIIWLPIVTQVRNPRLTKALIKQLKQLSADIHTHTEFKSLILDKKKIKGVKTNQGDFFADNIIICGGAWSAEILRTEDKVPAVRPVHGQMILFQTPPDTISRIVLDENRYIIPRRDGKVLFGSTIEEIGFKKQITADAKAELIEIACSRFPVLNKAEVIHHWSGLRPGSPAGVPYICQHSDYDNLFINAGHFRNGVVLAPASCQLMADLVLKREPILDPRPYGLMTARG